MPDPQLTLIGESTWVSPYVFHAMVALEEKRLPYKLELVPLPIPADKKAQLTREAVIGKVPILVHDKLWFSESLAISEYLAERFPVPEHPRIFPADLGERARARQIMSMLRTSLMSLREERPTSSLYGKPVKKPLSDKAKADADELVQIAERLIGGKQTLFTEWCIADADLALALLRLTANGDAVPKSIADYVKTQWARPSLAKYRSHVPA